MPIFKKGVRIAVGVFLIIIGLILSFVPFLPGIVLIVVGLEISGLSFLYPQSIKKARNKFYAKAKNLFSRKKDL
jgi:uncharacterized protein YqgC (DUF456 family)